LRQWRALIDAGRMTTTVLHHPRVAWDLARTTVAMAEASDELYQWFAAQLDHRLNPSMRDELERTRDWLARSVRPDAHPVQLGRWRVRFEDVLDEDPRIAEDLTLLRLQANSRLAG
jgi:hypothetical protein